MPDAIEEIEKFWRAFNLMLIHNSTEHEIEVRKFISSHLDRLREVEAAVGWSATISTLGDETLKDFCEHVVESSLWTETDKHHAAVLLAIPTGDGRK